MLPLEGVTVVSLEQAVAAPFATRQLADLGARVIKIERPETGDFARNYDQSVHGESSYFVWLNRGKESIELDVKHPQDRELLSRLIEPADVFVQNLAPGAVDRLGLDHATLRGAYPGLIHCSISGYGPIGPYRNKKAYDLLVQCESGALGSTGSGDELAKIGFSVADVATGMYAYTGILSALLRRERTGQGATVEVAMLDAMAEWMMQPMYYSVYGGHPVRRTGARHPSIAPYGPYRVGDARRVFLSVQNDREWKALCEQVILRPDLVTDERFATNTDRVLNDEQITDLLELAFASLSAVDVADLLDRAGIANARLRYVDELPDHPALVARDRWRTTLLSDGTPVKAMLPPAAMDGGDAAMGAIPRLGEHNESLRLEFMPESSSLRG
ncbi:CaiB/BaiF CoA transferase family protein [Arthrobacter bambusae]|uniref:CaiB/BaiF CoA transferase family protein n=1 Tax=Arthrobacter bambusae TaxID=1338426 RepID=UPI0027845AFE|nr:CaiB/BaiF CoA-transferase family protein [Arthrobacter bambusae]MDQ0241487.1 crotonobetainyl-CoA:carnitine CoA-transferase CaiB-like acyl-CoA transferase [Arthrobacter bambusae]